MLTTAVVLQPGLSVPRSFAKTCFAATLALLAATPAHGGSNSALGHGNNLQTSTGGTGLTSRGSGGTGLPMQSLQSVAPTTPGQLRPSKPHISPPAGVRPHTDLANGIKTTGESSARLMKHTSLYPKQPPPPGDPLLVKPYAEKIGATIESARSFVTLPNIPADLSKGRIYPTHGGTSSGGHPSASLSSGHAYSDVNTEAAETPEKGGWLTTWLTNALAALGTLALCAWLWIKAPKGARMTLPVKVAA